MNQGIVFALAATVLVATVAAAHVAVPLPDGTPRGSAKAATGTMQPVQASAGQLSPVKPAIVETRQAPVPILVRERPPVVLPAVETASATVPAPSVPTVDSEANSFAKGAIEADGYKFVKNITQGPDGTWRARALRGKTEVVLTVDREGRVSAD